MKYESSIHLCLTARERQLAHTTVTVVDRENKYREPRTLDELQERVASVIVKFKRAELRIHEATHQGRLDVLVGDRTIMSWTPILPIRHGY